MFIERLELCIVRAYDAKNHRYVGNTTLRVALAFLISEPISRAFLSIRTLLFGSGN